MLAPAESPEDVETRIVLLELAKRRFGAIAPARIVDHVLAMTQGADYALRRAALEALIRRHGFAERDELRVSERPGHGATLGTYRTKSVRDTPRGKARPYATALISVEPLRTSCSCPDFVRSSLGLCKHGLVVLEQLEKRGALARRREVWAPTPRKSRLGWSAVHPFAADADRLARIVYTNAGRGAAPTGLRAGSPAARTLRSAEPRLALIVDLERRIARGSLEPEPAVVTILAEERARAERTIHAKASVRPAMKALTSLARKLYPYQRAGVLRFLTSARLLLADDMGLGKTTQAIAACHGLFETAQVKRGLLIVPAALKPQWKREWESTTHAPLVVVEGSPAERARTYEATKRGFLIVSYEQLLRDFAQVQRCAPELVVLDEAQRIKNWATKSAAYVKALAPRYRLVLTGTPMENRLAELASIMDFVDDLALEPKWRLLPFHTVSEGDAGKGIGGAKNLDVLRARLAGSMLRRVRKDVLAQLPARTDTRVPVEMTELQRSHHDELRRPIAELASKAAKRPLRPPEFLQLMQLLATQRMICNGMAQVHFDAEWPHLQTVEPSPDVLERLAAPKLSALRGLVEQVVVGQQRKAVVFSQWRNMLRLSHWAVRDALGAAGMRAVFFTGAESSKQRERAIVEFHDDPATTLMFLSDAGGVGLNLQRAASCCINLELPWNPAVLEQRIGRIYRLGQTLPIDVYNLVTEEGIEANIAKLLGKKRAVFSTLFDGTSDSVLFDGEGSFMEGVKQLVEPMALLPVAPSELSSDEEPLTQLLEAADAAPAQPEALEATAAASIPGLTVARLPDGALRIEAPAELAGPLAELLETLARALRATTPVGVVNRIDPACPATMRRPPRIDSSELLPD